MSGRQWFNEVEAVASVLDDYVQGIDPGDFFPSSLLADYDTEELFTAIWQAVELLSRAYQVLLPLAAYDQAKTQLEYAKGYLDIPDPVVTQE